LQFGLVQSKTSQIWPFLKAFGLENFGLTLFLTLLDKFVHKDLSLALIFGFFNKRRFKKVYFQFSLQQVV